MAEIVDRKLIEELSEREEKRLQEATPKSAAMYERAKGALVAGVSSSYQERAHEQALELAMLIARRFAGTS